MTSNKKEDVDAHQRQAQVDKNLTMDASTKLPVVNVVNHSMMVIFIHA